MGKRKHKDKHSSRKDKIRRLADRLRRYQYDGYSTDSSDYYDDHRRDYSHSPQRYYYSRSSSPDVLYNTDSDNSELRRARSVVGNLNSNTEDVPVNTSETQKETPTAINADPTPSTSGQGASTSATTELNTLPDEILEALGDPKGKDEVFGPKIPEELSKRWGRVLVDGLTKEQKQELTEKTLIPDNFRLVKAPLLNPEIVPVLGEAVKNRDKLLEKAQNHLGLGIAGLTSLASALIEKDLNKIEILKKVSEVSQVFLDLHHENTNTRRKLVITSLDKKFTDIIKEAKRDSLLFGSELGEKIKASKTAERSGFHIKRNNAGASSSSRKFPSQGNWKGPPRTQGQRAYRPGGPRNPRYSGQTKRMPPPAADRATTTVKPGARTRKP